MAKKSKHTLFEVSEPWEEHWQGMPEYNQSDKQPFKSINVHFSSEEGVKEFAKLVDQKITSFTQFIWYPKKEKVCRFSKMYADES